MRLTEQQRAELERRMEDLRVKTERFGLRPSTYAWEWSNSVLAVLEALVSAMPVEVEDR